MLALRDEPYIDDGNPKHTFDLYLPQAADLGLIYPVVEVVHGGGGAIGTNKVWRAATESSGLPFQFAQRLNCAGFIVVAPKYGLSAPDDEADAVVWPQMGQDLADCHQYVIDHAADWGGDPDRIGRLGGSNGGFEVVRNYGIDPDTVKSIVSWSGGLYHMEDLWDPGTYPYDNVAENLVYLLVGCLPASLHQEPCYSDVLDASAPPNVESTWPITHFMNSLTELVPISAITAIHAAYNGFGPTPWCSTYNPLSPAAGHYEGGGAAPNVEHTIDIYDGPQATHAFYGEEGILRTIAYLKEDLGEAA